MKKFAAVGLLTTSVSILFAVVRYQAGYIRTSVTVRMPLNMSHSQPRKTLSPGSELIQPRKIPVRLIRGRALGGYKKVFVDYAFSLFRHSSIFTLTSASDAIIVTDSTSGAQFPNHSLILVQGLDGANKFQKLPNTLLFISHIAFQDRNLYRVSRTPLHTLYGYTAGISNGALPTSRNSSFDSLPNVEVALPQHWPFVHENAYGGCMEMHHNRSIDVTFSGRIQYEDRTITHHRQRCISALKNFTHSGIVTKVSERRLKKPMYVALLKATKLFVSPFGHGEWSSKTYEAISYGAIPILPFKEVRMETLPNLVEYVPLCKMDFSDLERVVLSVLENLSVWRLRMRVLCQHMRNREALFSEALRRVETHYAFLHRGHRHVKSHV